MFSEVVKTARYLKKLERKTENVKMRFSFTITPWNYKELEKVLRSARKIHTDVGMRLAHVNANLYGNEEKSKVLCFEENVLMYVHKVLKREGLNVFQKEAVVTRLKGRKLPCSRLSIL